ncbi:Glycosyl transferase, family 2 [Candidatus Rhodobacter oscarellae]|uniref:Glycosyl transferase, family 2 n=1 Tax=Candidatus Rhodobacter oscarellae TaxID=1675527 RepID=A0A0J9E7S1_9RHOB|nr:glycosyltransferase [Candidatus Rhodobacter lobularis]KMW58777.1 Glycosyl transferase, family 2 [Candidatus Rhodobacter lobularis]
MTEIPISVVIVSRDRPASLQRCLEGIEQLFYGQFEVVIVADRAGCDAVRDMGLGEAVSLIEFNEANISAARNLGIAQAAGEVVAFIDDDSVPEPTWLNHLSAPFANHEVVAAGGYVRGRNGISFQSRANWVDTTGRETAIAAEGAHVVLTGAPGKAVKTEGTNCAFRRGVLAKIGGFDPNFRFFLDETDVNMRLAKDHHKTAVVPLAQVHHGFHASRYRAADRTPRSLTEIGASQAVFLRKHALPDMRDGAMDAFRQEQRARLVRNMVAGACEPRDVSGLMAGLESGIQDGLARSLEPPTAIPERTRPFKVFQSRVPYGDPLIMTGHRLAAGRLRAEARAAAAQGRRVTLFLFGSTALYHRASFQHGFWEQIGGLFGKSDRNDKIFKPWRRKSRVAREKKLLADIRITCSS